MKKILQFVLMMAFIASPAFASTHYILQSASGSGTGADWTNACTAFSGSCAVSNMVRGDTWYVAGGTYSGPLFNKAVSGTTLITVKSATVADHGTATGWNNSFVSLVTFTGGIDFTTGFWVLDGQTGGGPTAYTTGFGISITQTSSTPVVEVDAGANNVTVRHASLIGTSNSSGGGSIAQDAFAIKGASNFTASFYYTNAIGRCPFFCGGTGNACPSLIAEYGYIGTYVSTSAQHSEVMSTATMAGDIDFRYNLVTHIEGTGGIMWDNSGSHTAQLRVYGNTFYRATTDNSWANTANGIIGGFTGGGGEDNFNMMIYNNNFVNVNGTIVFTNFIIRFGGNVVENNVFYNTTASIDYTDIATHDYNHYISSGGTHSEPNGSSGTGDPFVADTSLNFQLLANTPAGLTLASPYTTDPVGVTRGSPAAWSRGAFQFVPSTPTVATPTASPVAGSYVGTQTITLSTLTAGATICYTTNGSTPAATTPGTCSTGTTYSTPFSVASSLTVQAIGTLSGSTNSSVGSFSYTITPATVASPVASPVAGTYAGTKTVTLSTSTAGATICYTTDGSTPTTNGAGTCTHGTTYSSGFNVTLGTTTVKAIGTLSGDTDSSILTAAYTITGRTWFIRTDGGTNTQCTGLTNAAYPGSGSAQACGFNHPYQMMNSSGGWANFVGGDTIQFVKTGASDTYFTGEQNSGVGTDWHSQISGVCPAANSGSAAAGCILPTLPSGTAANHTRVLGQNVGSCHDSGHTHLVNPTILSGISGSFAVLDVRASNFVDISCIAITQPDTCSAVAGSGIQCNTATSNYVGFGGIIFNYFPGSVKTGPSNLTINDVAVVGLSASGILGGNVNTTLSDVTTTNDFYLIGNGQAGYNADSGGCGTSCEDIGTWNVSHNITDWNGCVAVKPYDFTKADTANAYNGCTDDSTAGGGGYGDGWVMIASNSLTLNVDHSFFRWNTQDGFDSLHLSDDSSHSPAINISTSWAEGDGGQTFKLGGGAASSAINNVSIHNCLVMQTASNFPLNPSGWNANLGDFCRPAGRNQWAFQLNNAMTLTLENNTSVGYGTTMYDIECSQAPGQTNCAANGAKVQFNNNISFGFPDPGNSNRLPSGIFLGTGVTTAIFSGGAANNSWFHMFATTGCPDSVISPTPTNSQCGDPLLVAESNVNAINPNLTSISPMIGHGEFISGITTDYNGTTRPNPPSIGAFEFVGAGTVANPSASPVAGTYSSAQNVTLSTVTAGATICYTTDGTTPTATTPGTCSHGTTYVGAITVATSQTILAIGTLSGNTNSGVSSFAYVINIPVVATPTATPAPGAYSSARTVSLSTSTSGATICYTIDGTTPTATTPGTCSHGTTYSTPITVSVTTTITAIGTKTGSINSSVASFGYTITPAAITTFGGTLMFGASQAIN